MMKPDYGIDAPGVRRGMFIAGLLGALLCVLAFMIAGYVSGWMAHILAVVSALSAVAAVYGFGMAFYMTYGSRRGKQRTRERLLDLANSIAPWTGGETVLDVGCGRGLMMIGAARRLTTGKAIGIDVWRAEDQADNSPEAALENARREGVFDRVKVDTGDARKIPYGDGSFDMVLSHWVIHNIESKEDRSRALDEMVRVLRPDGTLVLADIAHHAEYRMQLAARGFTDIRIDTGGWESLIIGVLSGGSFRPQALVGRRA